MEDKFPEIDAEKLMTLRAEMLQAQANMDKAQQKYWQAEAEFNSYVRYGDGLSLMQNAVGPAYSGTIQGAKAGYGP